MKSIQSRDCEHCEYYKPFEDRKYGLELRSCSKWECVKGDDNGSMHMGEGNGEVCNKLRP